jgi:sugar lactone lactonase YvrE
MSLSFAACLLACTPTGVNIDPVTKAPSTATLPTQPGTTTGQTGPTTGVTDTGSAYTTTYDCTQPAPTLPATWVSEDGYSDAEDFDFDGAGLAIAIYSGNLTGREKGGPYVRVISPGLINGQAAGTRVLPTGDYVVADVGRGTIELVDGVTGGADTLASGFNYPNGIEVDRDNNVYVADQDEDKIVRINAYDTTDFEVVAEVSNPNGLVLSPDGQTMYAGTFGIYGGNGNKIYKIDRDPAGGWMEATVLYQSGGGDGGYDGINVDVCGNVYWTEFIEGKVWRMLVGDTVPQRVATLPSYWIPNLRWGHDIGGWDRNILYVSDRQDGRIFELDMGIPGKKHVLMP